MQGQVAVMLFFIVSGFVIKYSTVQKAHLTFKEYFLKRFLRIYPVFILSLLISYVTASINANRWFPFQTDHFLLNLLNFQDLDRHPGYWYKGYFENTPLWSISYEWWF